MEGNIAATYTLIYRFLKQQSQHKAAEAVKKAAKPLVVLRDDIEHQGAPLEDIIKQWRLSKNTKPKDASSSSEESESSDDSSSDSEDGSSSEDTSGSEGDTSDSDESGDESPKVKKVPPKGAMERDTSATLSSAEENARGAARQVVQVRKEKSAEDDSESSDSSDSDSSDSDDSSESSDGETSSSNSGSSDEVETNKGPKNKQTTTKGKSPSSSESGSDSEDESESEPEKKEDAHVVKKRKISGSEAVAVEPIARSSQKKEEQPLKVRSRFQRVKLDNFAPEVLLDNGYKARGGASNDYGQQAHRDLVVTRGAGFRKEKNKKKRGSYRGGEITMESHSIKFDF